MRKTALFALCSGCFTAGLLGTPVVLLGLSIGPLSPLVLAGIVALCAGIGGTAGARVTVTPKTAERLQERGRLVLAGFGVAGLYAVSTLFTAIVGPGLDSGFLYGGLGGSALVTVGIAGMADVSQSLYAASIVTDSDFYVPLPNTKTERQRRIEHWIGAVGLVALAGFALFNYLTDESIPLVLILIATPGIVQLLFTGGREQAITDAGLKRGHSVRPWSEFDGFEQSETHLTLTQPGWGTGIRIHRDRIDDEDAVLSALETVFENRRE